ncbi:ornithine cyclodeaminase family protein [Thermovorax subterraneus]|nr:ornithine cyclodeaminase family protein [Thermovorax subterraneus]
MLILGAEKMKKLLHMKEAIEAVKEAYKMVSEGKCYVPLRTNISVEKHGGQILFMPGYVDGIGFAGVKIVSVYPENAKNGLPSVPATMVLIDGTTGIVKAVMDGTYLTRLRTGAASGAATEVLAKKDAKKAILFGTGGQAREQLWALLTVRRLEEVYVCGRDFEKAKEFARRMSREFEDYGAKVTAVEKADEVLSEVDIITTATTSRTPVFNGSLVKKGVHINAIGSFTPEMQELPEEVVLKADRVFVDSKEACLAEAGDFLVPMMKGLMGEEKIIGEIGEVFLGKTRGRTSEDEITIFKSVGLAVQDIVTAAKIYEKAVEQGLGSNLEI